VLLPPATQISPKVHVPIPPEPRPGPPIAPQYNFRGREFAHLNPRELSVWRSGSWRHESHAGYFGWWWLAGGIWYFYPQPIYPYPTYISNYLIPVPAPVSPQFWYYCDDPPGYYPDVQACYDAWQPIPVAPPPPAPSAIGPQASADVRSGYRIAQAICSTCHIVQPAQARPPVLVQPGPTFMEIANRPDSTPESLRNFISSTGWDMQSRPITMPNQRLSDQSIGEVVSYIMSLKSPPR
jgi:mono/diheme cytochrome c family protein